MGKRDEYIEKTKQRLDELNADLAKLEARMEQASGEAKAKQQEMLAKLKTQRESLRAKFKELRDEGEESWEHMKDEVERVRKAFVQSVNYFKSQL